MLKKSEIEPWSAEGQTKGKEAENSKGLKKRRSSEADTLEHLKERNERIDAIKHEDIELRREELRLQAARQEAAIQLQQLQPEAQQRQFQQFQTMMLSITSTKGVGFKDSNIMLM